MTDTKLYDKLIEIEKKVDLLLTLMSTQNNTLVNTFLELPTHLQKTFYYLQEHKEVTASFVATRTGRARALESAYLNQLVTLGKARKFRIGKPVHFSISK